MRLMKAFPLGVLAAAWLSSTALMAQSSPAAQRITTDVNELSLATLKGNVPRLARAEFDQGEAAPSTQLTHMRLVLSRSSEQQAALDSYLAQLQDKSSPNYHKWLTPEQFGQLYGPADSDIAALVAWLESHGFQVDPISAGRTNIAFSGSVSQVEAAFHTSIHSYQAADSQFYSNTTDPQIPSALAPVVMGVAQLNTIRPRPYSVRGGTGRINQQTGRSEPNSTPANGPSPMLTSGGSLFIVPADAATIYDTPNALNANFSTGTSYSGTGVNIGIGGDEVISASIVGTFRSTFLGVSTLPIINYCTTSSSCSTTNLPSTGNTGDADEAYIDTELSGGLAPGATIYFYYSSDLNVAIEAALDANVVSIFSLSFGECEANMTGGGNAQLSNYWSQAAAEGIAVAVSSGDSGSASCDGDTAKVSTVARLGLSVSGYASTPYNIAVGGTDFYALGGSSFSSYVSSSAGAAGAPTYYRTVLGSGPHNGYIPESIWNDSTTSDTQPLADNVAETGKYASIVAGSGGVSSCATGSGNTCTGYPMPPWQTGAGIPATVPSGVNANARSLPDVSVMSGNGYDAATWLICDGEYPCTSISSGFDSSGGFDAYGGTSTAAPAFAGILAMVEQKTGSRLGQAAQELYALYNGSHAASVFHDVTVGNNSVPCVSGTPNCALDSESDYFETGYNALTGYDLASGLGSVDATQLVNYWNSSIGTAAATVTVNVTPNPATIAQSLTVTISVSGSSGTPTGTVVLTSGTFNPGAQTLATSGTCTAASCVITVPADSLAIGADTLTVTYSGDTTYATKTNSSTTVTVTGLTASVSVIPSPTSINSNQILTVSGTVTCTGTCTGSTTPTGTVTLTGGGYNSGAQTLSISGSYSFTIPYNTFGASGSVTLTAMYSGNTTYSSASSSVTVPVTYVAVSTPTVTVTPASGSIDSSQSLSVAITVSGASTLESSPTGTVTLVSGSYTSRAQTLATSGSCTAALCTITIAANGLSVGSDTLTATYSGDADYASGSGTASVTVTPSVFALAATSPGASIAPGASTTSTITVSSSTFYSGTVTLTCALTTSPSGAAYLPSCSSGSNTVTLSSTTTSGTATITVSTTAATASLAIPKLPGKGWAGAGGGAVLAFLLFLGIPARRRSWRSMLGILVLMAALGSLTACGGGSGTTGTSGTTAGTYTFTVTGSGSDTNKTTETATFTVTVN